MQCPLYAAQLLNSDDVVESADVECDKEKCAWWFPTTQECAIKELAHILSGISSTLIEVGEKMPHEV